MPIYTCNGRVCLIPRGTPPEEINRRMRYVQGGWATKDGQPITFKCFDQDPEDLLGTEDGWVVRRVEAHVDGELAGYLKITYIPEGQDQRDNPTSPTDYAVVSFIRVYDDINYEKRNWQRQGIGTALYIEGARWLRERFDLRLHSADRVRGPQADATWKAMQARGYPVLEIERFDGRVVFALNGR